MANFPLGQLLYGQARYGDGSTVSLLPRLNALSISYVISPSKYTVPLGITYTVEYGNTTPLLIYYLITPPSNFAINGDGSIIRPDRITYTPRPVTARTLLGGPYLQGYRTVTWSYTVLQWTEFQQIISHYDPTNPVVTLTYPDETGTWVQRSVVMHPPQYGDMTNFIISNVILSFTRIL